MWTMGKDNGYAFADVWYSNMDKLIQIMNTYARNDFKTPVPKLSSWPTSKRTLLGILPLKSPCKVTKLIFYTPHQTAIQKQKMMLAKHGRKINRTICHYEHQKIYSGQDFMLQDQTIKDLSEKLILFWLQLIRFYSFLINFIKKNSI